MSKGYCLFLQKGIHSPEYPKCTLSWEIRRARKLSTKNRFHSHILTAVQKIPFRHSVYQYSISLCLCKHLFDKYKDYSQFTVNLRLYVKMWTLLTNSIFCFCFVFFWKSLLEDFKKTKKKNNPSITSKYDHIVTVNVCR